MSKKLRDRVADYMVYLGYAEVPMRSNKHRKFQVPIAYTEKPYDIFYFVGKSGGCRMGRSYVKSVSVTDFIKRELVRTGR